MEVMGMIPSPEEAAMMIYLVELEMTQSMVQTATTSFMVKMAMTSFMEAIKTRLMYCVEELAMTACSEEQIRTVQALLMEPFPICTSMVMKETI